MKRLLYISSAMLLAFSCTSEPINEFSGDQEVRTFAIDIDETKTTVDGLHISWVEGDTIGVFDQTVINPFIISRSGDKFIATGHVTAGATKFAGLYPYNKAAKKLNTAYSSSPMVTAEYKVAGGSNIPLASIFTSDNTLEFSPATAVFKFTIENDDDGKYISVTITGNNEDKSLCGTCIYNHNTGAVTVTNSGSSINFTPDSPIPAGTYYLPFYVSGTSDKTREFSGGITIEGRTATGAVYRKNGSASFLCYRGKIYNCGALPTAYTKIIPGDPSAKEYVTQSVKFTDTYKTAYTTYQARTAGGMQRMDRICEGWSNQDQWGGWNGVKPDSYISTNPEGFWRTGRWKGRSVMVDPDGNVAILRGVNYVCPEPMCRASTDPSRIIYENRFPTDLEWSEYAGKLLDSLGFNMFMVGPSIITNYRKDSMSDHGVSEAMEQNLRQPTATSCLSQIEWLNFLIHFKWKYPNLGQGAIKSDAPWLAMMFDPDYLSHIESVAKTGAELFKDSRNFIGYYSDNELGIYEETTNFSALLTLKNFLALKGISSPRYCSYAYDWAIEWMQDNYSTTTYDASMEEPFIEAVVEYYYRTAAEAIHKYDPNHLYLGSRLHYNSKKQPTVLRACAKYCDVVSMNYYENVFEPVEQYFSVDLPASIGEKPYLVTEFYVKNMTAPYVHEGAGDFTDCQKGRGLWYSNFCIKLIEDGNCAGWQWFKYNDDYRTDGTAYSGTGWVNKGIIKSDMTGPYTECTDIMKELNRNSYQILDYYTK